METEMSTTLAVLYFIVRAVRLTFREIATGKG